MGPVPVQGGRSSRWESRPPADKGPLREGLIMALASPTLPPLCHQCLKGGTPAREENAT